MSLPVPGHGLSHAPDSGCGAAARAAAPSGQVTTSIARSAVARAHVAQRVEHSARSRCAAVGYGRLQRMHAEGLDVQKIRPRRLKTRGAGGHRGRPPSIWRPIRSRRSAWRRPEPRGPRRTRARHYPAMCAPHGWNLRDNKLMIRRSGRCGNPTFRIFVFSSPRHFEKRTLINALFIKCHE